jgi:hypothetical protein
MRLRALWLALVGLLLATGCPSVTRLQPLPSTPTTPAGGALTEAQGGRLVAQTDVWRGRPSHLDTLVTPVRVRLENHSGRPLRISYDHFELVGDSRFTYSALSPFEVRTEGLALGGAGDVGVLGPRAFGWGLGWQWGGGPGPWRGRHGGPWGPLWNDPFFNPYWDPWWGSMGGPYPPYWRPAPRAEPLPTRDMLRRALPEGILEDGASVTGFLYFQDVGEREQQVLLQARLVDARTEEPFGTLSIPFQVRD